MEVWDPDTLKSKLDGGERVFLKVWQKGCGPCKLSTPAVERIEKDNKHNLTFAQICSDDYPQILELANVEIMPAFFVFADQKMLGKFFGFKGLKKLEEFVDGLFV